MDKDEIYIEEIKEFCGKVIEFTQNLSFEQFCKDERTQLAIIKLIENVGEASKRLSEESRKNFPNVDWKKATRTHFQNTSARDISQCPQDQGATTKVYPLWYSKKEPTQVLWALAISQGVVAVLPNRGVVASEL